MGDFMSGLSITDLLTATIGYNQQQFDNRLALLKAQADINGIPSKLSNPNASSSPATPAAAQTWMQKNGLMLALVLAGGFVAWKVLK